MGLQVVRPISLVDGILDITNAEDSRVEFTGSLSNGLLQDMAPIRMQGLVPMPPVMAAA